MSRRTRVYVSGPVSAVTLEEEAANMLRLEQAGMQLRIAGYAPFVPSTDMRVLGSDGSGGLSHDEWLDCDTPYVEVSDCLLRLAGVSKGADVEMELAQDIGIPVYYSIKEVVRDEPNRRYGDDRFHRLLQSMGRLHDRKQQDYGTDGDPFANVRASEDFGVRPWVGALVRLHDKVTRLKNFARKGQLANESAVDSMLDIAVYSLIAKILYDEEGE